MQEDEGSGPRTATSGLMTPDRSSPGRPAAGQRSWAAPTPPPPSSPLPLLLPPPPPPPGTGCASRRRCGNPSGIYLLPASASLAAAAAPIFAILYIFIRSSRWPPGPSPPQSEAAFRHLRAASASFRHLQGAQSSPSQPPASPAGGSHSARGADLLRSRRPSRGRSGTSRPIASMGGSRWVVFPWPAWLRFFYATSSLPIRQWRLHQSPPPPHLLPRPRYVEKRLFFAASYPRRPPTFCIPAAGRSPGKGCSHATSQEREKWA